MRIAFWTGLHLNSRRIPKKVLQLVGGRPLCVYGLEAIAEAAMLTGCPAYCLVCPEEKELFDLVEGVGIIPQVLTAEAANTDDIELIYGRAREEWVGAYDHMIAVNTCSPFLTVATIVRAVKFARSIEGVKWAAAEEVPTPMLWDDEGDVIMRDDAGSCNTFRAKRVYIHRHTMRGLSPVDMTTSGFSGGYVVPFVIDDPKELMDVDTPFDLDLVRGLLAYAPD